MATAFDITNEVLLAFINSNRIEMTLIELHTNLTSRKIRISTDEILRILRSESLVNLFNLQVISNNLYLIQLNPKVSRNFLKNLSNQLCFCTDIVNSL
jgi:hypothetical protein